MTATTTTAPPDPAAEAAELGRQAGDAERAADAAEAAALLDGQDIDPAVIEEKRTLAARLRFRSKSAARRAEKAAEAARLVKVGELRRDVLEYAAGAAGGELRECLDLIAASRARFLRLVSEHNAVVAEFDARAVALGVAALPPGGIPSAGGALARAGGGIAAGGMRLVPYPVSVLGHPATVIDGHAVALPEIVVRDGRKAPDHVAYSLRGGSFSTFDGEPGAAFRQQVRDGHLVELSPAQAARWLAGGEPFTGPAEVQATSRAQMAAQAAVDAERDRRNVKADQAAQRKLGGH